MNDSKPDRLMPALAGGAFLGIASALPYLEYVNCACCALVIGGGFLSVFVFKRKNPNLSLTYGDGALLGVLAGFVGAIIGFLVFLATTGASGIQQTLEAAASNPEMPPEWVDVLNRFQEVGVGPLIAISFVVSLVRDVAFGTLGGVLGVALLEKKPPQAPPAQWSQPQPPGSYQPPQPPPYEPPSTPQEPPPTPPESGGDAG